MTCVTRDARAYRMLWTIGLLLAVFLAWPGASWAETVYAKKDGIKVTQEKSPTSAVLATLRTGDAVEVIKKDGRQYQVKLSSGKVGWVFAFNVTDSKPAASSGGSGLSGLTGKNIVVAKEARAGGSIRGLKETTEQYAERKRISPAHRAAVDKMESRVIPQEELAKFQREGGVGEYSGGGQ